MRVPRRVRRLGGAVAGQFSQALVSFVLQVVAARSLGAGGLGSYALLYSVILTGSAISNGLVGDSLTVLDRMERSVRQALVNWSLISSGLLGLVGAACFFLAHDLSLAGATWFALAGATFVLQSNLRRLLMATLRFWSLVIVDTAGLVVSLLTIIVWSRIGKLDIDAMLVAWVAGQLFSSSVAWVLLPGAERWILPGARAQMRQVFGYGAVRAAQQTIRPGMLTLARLLMVAAAGRVTFGAVEASRIYMAPALLVVQGIGSYLFASYARSQDAETGQLVRRADLAAVVMSTASLVMGALAAALAPEFGSIVTGSSFSVDATAVVGWAVFAAATAANMPYGSLAAVRGRQRPVLWWAAGVAALTLVVVGVLVQGLGTDIVWVPFVLAAGSFVQGWVVRSWVLKPMTRSSHGNVVVSTS